METYYRSPNSMTFLADRSCLSLSSLKTYNNLAYDSYHSKEASFLLPPSIILVLYRTLTGVIL